MTLRWKRCSQRSHTFVVNRIIRFANVVNQTMTEEKKKKKKKNMEKKKYSVFEPIFPPTRQWCAAIVKVCLLHPIDRTKNFLEFYSHRSLQTQLNLANGMVRHSIAVNSFDRCNLNWECVMR